MTPPRACAPAAPWLGVLGLALAGGLWLATGTASAHEGSGRPAGLLRWERDYRQALKKAKTARRPVMIDFWAEWCQYCHELDRTTYTDPRVLRLTADFVPATVDTEGGARDRALSERFDIRELPTILFVTPEGRSLLRVEGFQGPDPFLATLERAKALADEVMALEVRVASHPDDAQALARLGSHLFGQAETEDSLGLLTRAVSQDALSPSVDRKRTRLEIAVLQARKKQYAKAEAAFAEARGLAPAGQLEPRLLLGLVQGFLAGGKKEAALRVVDEIATCCAGDPVALEVRDLLAAPADVRK